METKQIDKDVFFDIITQLKELNVDQVMISGGEPLLHKDIVEMIKFIHNKGIKIIFNTNGISLDQHLSELPKFVDVFVISLDGSNSEIYQRIRGVNAFSRVIEGVKNLKERLINLDRNDPSRVVLRCTIQKQNLLDIINIQNVANELHCPLGLNPIDAYSDNFGREKIIRMDLIPSAEETVAFRKMIEEEDMITRINENNKVNAVWTKEKFLKLADYFDYLREGKEINTGNSVCTLPYSNLIFDANGDIKVCFYHKCGNLNEQKRLSDYTKSNFLMEILDELQKTQKCTDCRCKIFC